LPAEFHALEPHAVEDVLNIFQEQVRFVAPSPRPPYRRGEGGADSPYRFRSPLLHHLIVLM